MSTPDTEIRLARLENEVADLDKKMDNLQTTIGQLNITIALLNQTMETLKGENEGRHQYNQRVSFFVVGGIVSAIITFIVKGGLSL